MGLDVDPLELPRTEARLRALGFGEDVLTVRRMNFAGIASLSTTFDLVLADLGVSSMQIDNPARGFTYKAEGPLDLRLNPGRGRPASALLQSLPETELAELFAENADEPFADLLATGPSMARTSPPPPSWPRPSAGASRASSRRKHASRSSARCSSGSSRPCASP